MEQVKFEYKAKSGILIEITDNLPQYIFLEPLASTVVRYYFTRDGLLEDDTRITKQVVNPDLLSVKIRPTNDPLISQHRLFKDIDVADTETFQIVFNSKTEFVDILYTNLTEDRMKVKVSTFTDNIESFENENSYTDGPDEIVRLTKVSVDRTHINGTYIYRKDGRLKMYPFSEPYSNFYTIVKERILQGSSHTDRDLPLTLIERGINKEGWTISKSSQRFFKNIKGREIEITKEELGAIIRDYASPLEILHILKSVDYKKTGHFLMNKVSDNLLDCDTTCSLPPSEPKDIIDNRSF